jgi:hypothetical protein
VAKTQLHGIQMTGDQQKSEYEYQGEHTEDLLERSRLEALFSARQAAADALRESESMYQQLRQGVSATRARNLSREKVRSSVVAYALEAESLLRTDAGRHIYKEQSLGAMPVPHQPPLSPNHGHLWEQADSPGDVAVTDIHLSGVPESMIRRDGDDMPTAITVVGISSLLSLPSPITARYTLRSTLTYPESHDTSDRLRQLYPDTNIAAQAFRQINHLLDELEITLPVGVKSDSEAGSRYQDLVISDQ